MLSKLHALLQRESLVPYLNAKYLNVFTNYSHDLDAVSNMYETLKENPPMARDAPPVAGTLMITRTEQQFVPHLPPFHNHPYH